MRTPVYIVTHATYTAGEHGYNVPRLELSCLEAGRPIHVTLLFWPESESAADGLIALATAAQGLIDRLAERQAAEDAFWERQQRNVLDIGVLPS